MCKDSSKTTTSAPPSNVQAAYNSTLAQAEQTAAQPLQLYQGQMVAPLNSTQTGAISDITADQDIAQPYITAAQNDINAGTNAITPTPFSEAAVDQYESPYTSQVVNATEQQLQLQDAQQQQALQGNAVASGAYGGDRSAVLQSSLAGQQDVANNATIANLENAGYTQALGEFNTQQATGIQTQEANNANLQQAGYALGSLGTEAQNTALTGASAALNAGTIEQNLAQENLNVPYEQYLQEQAYPYQQEDFLSGIETGLGSLSGGTNTSTSNPGTLGMLQQLGIKTGGRVPRRHLDDGGASGPQGPSPLQLAQMNPIFLQQLASQDVSSGAPGGTSAAGTPTPPTNAGINSTAAASLLNVPNIAPTATTGSKRGGRIGLDAGGSAGLQMMGMSPAYLEMMEANQMDRSGGDSISPLPAVLNPAGGYVNSATGYVPTAANSAHGSGPPSASGGGGSTDGSSGTSPQSLFQTGQNTYNGVSSALSKFGSTSLPGDAGMEGVADMGADIGGEVSGAGEGLGSLLAFFAKRGGHVPLQDAVKWYRAGGRVKLADGGDASVDDIINSLYPGPGAGSASAATASAAPQPAPTQLAQATPAQSSGAGATLASPNQIPNAWAQAATHMASDPSAPRWDDGQPVDASGGRDITPAHKDTPDMGRAILTGLAGAFAGGKGLNVGQGLAAGINSYYGQEDKDNHPEADNSGPTTVYRYADGTVIDTGRPTEAAINAKATNDYRLTNMDMIKQEREDAIAQRAQAANNADADRKAQIKIAGMNAESGRYQWQPGTQADPNDPTKTVTGMWRLPTRGGEAPQFIAGDNLTPKAAGANAPGAPGTPEFAARAKAISNYQIAPGGTFGSNTPYATALQAEVLKNNPTYDGTRFGERSKVVNDFASGPEGNTTRSLNVVMDHLDTLNQYMQALNNGDIRVINSLKNAVSNQLGYPAPATVSALKPIVGQELVKAIVARGGGQAERQEAADSWNQATAPAQQQQILEGQQQLLTGQLHGLQRQYEEGTGLHNFGDKVSPKTAQRLGLMNAPAGGAQAAPASGSRPAPQFQNGQVYKDANGNRARYNNGQWQPVP